MDILDTYYRAFKEYRKQTLRVNACEKERRAMANSNTEQDKLQSTKYIVAIEEDWIKAIEDGLKFVEQAVAEERQFIRTNGEVVPIEKVRKISKDSVVHLAKHSDMITHLPEDDSDLIVPDEIYMVEKLSDYAVYENRFLYMMLCYIKNFIEYRLEKIDALRRSYVGDMYINKEIASKKRTLKVEMRVYEERSDNPYPIPDGECEKRIKRIGDCREIINSLLNTDLMQQVAKSPMIKPPIVKTNVLKMNNNFKNALALYDYIAGYKGDGFTSEEVKFSFTPYTENIADEIAESANLVSFLTYKAGNKIDDLLETNYQQEENRLKAEEVKKLNQRLARLKKRATESGKSLEEYMLVLEERNRQLEKDSEELSQVKLQLEGLAKQIDALNAEKEELNRRMGELADQIAEKEKQINDLKQKYIEDMAAAKRSYEAQIAQVTADSQGEIARINADYAAKMTETVNGYEATVATLNAQLAGLNAQCVSMTAECDKRIADMQFQMSDYENEKQRLMAELDAKMQQAQRDCDEVLRQGMQRVDDALKDGELKVEQERAAVRGELEHWKEEAALLRGELDGIRISQGKMTPSTDYTSRERFTELEEEYEAFQKFFKKQWEFTKKEIRKTILWAKDEKKKPVKD